MKKEEKNIMKDTALMYHSLESSKYPSEMTDAGDLLYVLSVDSFERQLCRIKEGGFRVSLAGDPGAEHVTSDGEDNNLTLTFDDGHITNHSIAYPILRDHGYKAHFFVTTDWINKDFFMTDEMIKELSADGMSIGSHGMTHSYLTDLDWADTLKELDSSKKRLEDLLGKPVKTLSVPGGRINKEVLKHAASTGYTDIFVSEPNPTLECKGVRVHGRLALKRGYSLAQFERMLTTGEQPDNPLIKTGVAIAKNVMGTENYRAFREAALRIVRSK